MTVAMIAHAAGMRTAMACQLPPRRCKTLRSDRPIRININDSRMNPMTPHVASAWARVAADRTVCWRIPTTTPHATVESTPDTCSQSPTM